MRCSRARALVISTALIFLNILTLLLCAVYLKVVKLEKERGVGWVGRVWAR